MPMPLSELLERYSLVRSIKPHSVSLYLMLMNRLERFLGRPATTADLDELTMNRYLKWREETPGWRGCLPSVATVKKDRNMLAALCCYAHRKAILKKFPDLRKIQVPEKLPTGKAYTAEDVQTLIRRAAHRIGRIDGLPANWWWGTLLYAIYCTGERVSATLAVRWRDVDLDRRCIVFKGENRKNSTRDIERQITPDLAAMLAEHRRDDAQLVWPWDRRSKSQWASLKVLCRSAGVKYRGFHGLRRTAASYAALAGGRAAATQLLDHSNPNLQRVYVDPLICPTGENSTAALPPLDLGGGPGKPR